MNMCSHIRMLLVPLIGDENTRVFVGECSRYSKPENIHERIAMLKEVNSVVHAVLSGHSQVLLDLPRKVKFWNVEENTSRSTRMTHTRYDGTTVDLDYRFRSRTLNWIIESADLTNPRHVKALAGLMRLHTSVGKEPSISRSGVMKAYHNITDPYEGTVSLSEYRTVMKNMTHEFLNWVLLNPNVYRKIMEKTIIPIWAEPPSEKVSFSLLEDNGSITHAVVSRESPAARNWWTSLRHPVIRSLYELNPDSFCSYAFVGVDNAIAKLKDLPPIMAPENYPLGSISRIPVDGYKDRIICVPHSMFGCLSRPSAGVLQTLCKAWRVQGVHDQQQAVLDIHKAILAKYKSGDRSPNYSLDLKAWTDRAPFEAQLGIIDALVEQGILSNFDRAVISAISKATYDFPLSTKGGVVKYAVGTPMGSYPSFPLASLFHGLVGMIAARNAGESFTFSNLPLRIVGDDMCSWSEALGLAHSRELSSLGLNQSLDKSVISPYTGEFCQRIIHLSGIFQKKGLNKSFQTVDQVREELAYYDESVELNQSDWIRVAQLARVPSPIGLGPELSPDWWEYHDPEDWAENELFIISARAELARSFGRLARISKFDMQDLHNRIDRIREYLDIIHIPTDRLPNCSHPHPMVEATAKQLTYMIRKYRRDTLRSYVPGRLSLSQDRREIIAALTALKLQQSQLNERDYSGSLYRPLGRIVEKDPDRSVYARIEDALSSDEEDRFQGGVHHER